jgi:DegV family protein with EDD domain
MLSLMVSFEIWIMKQEMIRSENKSRQIERLSRTQNRFFASMSHEIRTPINTIIGMNEMILRENASDEINEDAANIQAASKMLLHLINDILDMSKFESGQMVLNEQPYQTGNMLSEVVGMFWLRAREKNLEFRVEISPDLPSELLGDEVRIKQILINVINNAIKYTDKGYVKLQIQCDRIENQTANVIYSVTDTGIGIKKEGMPYLFTAFKRIDEDKNRYIEGTGLGLSIVKQFVDLMGGRITVNSIYTKGSTFMIEIPQKILRTESIGALKPERYRKDSRQNHYKESFMAPNANVLVVDDTKAGLLVVTKLLRDTKVQVTTASSGEEALRKTLETEFHVILMDHMMPKMDGIECMHAIRSQTGGLSRNAKMIALTANVGKEMELLYEKEGFDGYLMKPVNGNELESMVCSLLPKNLVVITGSREELEKESMSWIREHRSKARVAVTTESVADLPKSLLEKYEIDVIPHMVVTADGVFRDGIEIDTTGILAYMRDAEAFVETDSPNVEEHETFYSRQLDRANNIIHISISSKVAHSGCIAAMEAAANFDNVFVVDTGHLSSGQGLMAIEAARLVKEGNEPEAILHKLEKMRSHVHTSFIVESLEYLARAKQVSHKVAILTNAFMMHPVLSLKDGKMVVSQVFFGEREHAWEKYISLALHTAGKIDTGMLFITYVGMKTSELEHIKKIVETKMHFEEIYFQKASPAIAVNSGPGTFGLLFYTEYE